MYWYLAGAVFCLMAAVKLRNSGIGKKNTRQAAMVLAAGFAAAALAAWGDGQSGVETRVARSEPGQGSQEKEFLIEAQDMLSEYSLTVEVAEKKLTKTRKKQYLEQAKQELDQVVLGENPSLDQVTEPLYLPEYLQEGAVEAVYSFSDYDVFSTDGTIQQEPKQPVLVEVTTELDCQGEVCLYRFPVCAVPREKSPREQFVEKLKDLIADENQREDAGYLELPSNLEGTSITWKPKAENTSRILVLMAVAAAVAVLLREKEREKKKEIQRKAQMLLDYSSIVGKLSLLLGAGMNISIAWEKIALDYRQKRETGEIEFRYAYEEMLSALYEIRDGVGELQAYENFGKRCQLSEYRRLSALIVQNVRKGARGMQRLLEQEEWEAYDQRKAQAKQAGEEAGTKLLLPMGMMLVIVLAMLVIPAGMSLNL